MKLLRISFSNNSSDNLRAIKEQDVTILLLAIVNTDKPLQHLERFIKHLSNLCKQCFPKNLEI